VAVVVVVVMVVVVAVVVCKSADSRFFWRHSV
jgi:hypothetical protein